MENKDQIKGFFIEDEQTFEKDKILSLINRCKKFAKLIGREGRVHIENRNLTGTDKIKLFLITRYLGAEFAKIESQLKIPSEIANVHTSEIAKLLSVPQANARTRVSDLICEGFGQKPQKGYVRVLPHQISTFLDLLEKGEQKKERVPTKKSVSKRVGIKKILEFPKLNIDQTYKRLAINLNGISEGKLKDCIYIKDDGAFKFNKNFVGKSKHGRQTQGILCAAFVMSVGIGLQTFSSRQIKDICFNSNIDVAGLNYAIRELKKSGYISKASKHSQDNIILEKGKNRAKDIFSNLCK